MGNKLGLKIISFFFFISISQAFSQDVEDFEVSINFEGQTVFDALDDIQKDYPIRFFYKEDWLPSYLINQKFNQKPLKKVLESLLRKSDLTYTPYGDDMIIIVKKDKFHLFSTDYLMAITTMQNDETDPRFPTRSVGDSSEIGGSPEYKIRLEIIDKEVGHQLEEVNAYIEKLDLSLTSDKRGRIEMLLPGGIFQLELRRVGYEPVIRNLRVFSQGKILFEMEQEIVQLQEVIISSDGPEKRLMSPQAGVVTITPSQIKDIPVFLGEADVIKTILTIPGVVSIGEGTSGFYVRGGNVDQNLILQDAAIFSNASHALGFFSLYNPDLISSVRLYKGSVPAQYGGRLSSVLDVRLKGSNYSNTTVSGGVGTVMSKIALETPIVYDKVNLLVGGRWAYSDWILNLIKIPEIRESEVSFYDINVKLSSKISNTGSISAGYFQSFDHVNFHKEAGFEWTIRNLTINWNQALGQRLQSEFDASWGEMNNLNYDPSGLDLNELSNGQQYYKMKENLVFPLVDHLFIGGGEWIYYQPKNERLSTIGSSAESTLEKDYGQELSFYLNDEFNIGEKLSISAGLRTSMFQTEDRRSQTPVNVQYSNIEPRLSARIATGETSSIKASYNKMSQYIHLLSNTVGALPVDQWIVSNSQILPSISNNFSLGFFKNFDLNTWESSAEVFFRKMDNLIEFKDFANLIMNPDIEEEIIQGNSQSYGLELFLKKHTGKIKGSLAYTFSRSLVSQEVTDGSQYWRPAQFDKPHNVNLVMDFSVNKKSKLALVFNFSSGRPITVPVSSYYLGNTFVPHYSEKNVFRIPNYHRLDVSYTYKRNAVKRKRYKDSITFSIYNIYGRRNAFSVFFKKDQNNRPQAYKLSVLGSAFPAITYSFQLQ